MNSRNLYPAIPPILVAGSVSLTSANYDAFESNGGVNVCVTINATALERNLTLLLSSQDGTATSEERVCEIVLQVLIMFIKVYSLCI